MVVQGPHVSGDDKGIFSPSEGPSVGDGIFPGDVLVLMSCHCSGVRDIHGVRACTGTWCVYMGCAYMVHVYMVCVYVL